MSSELKPRQALSFISNISSENGNDMKMLNSLHFTGGFTEVLQWGIQVLYGGKTFWDTLSALWGLCGSQIGVCAPKMFYSLKLLCLINCPRVLGWWLHFLFRDLSTERFSRKGMIDFAFQPNYLFSPSSHIFGPFSLFCSSAKALVMFVRTPTREKKNAHPWFEADAAPTPRAWIVPGGCAGDFSSENNDRWIWWLCQLWWIWIRSVVVW